MSKTKHILTFILLGLYVSYYASATLFVHTHEYAWGTQTHSHPHSSHSHAHSAEALLLIDNLTNLLFVGGVAVFSLTVMIASRAFLSTVCKGHQVRLLFANRFLRGPPALKK